MEFTTQEKILLKMLLNQQAHFIQFNYKGSDEDKNLGLRSVISIQNKLEALNDLSENN
jgi:hypothetical protein